MYAVIRSGGKQYRVQSGQVLKLEKLDNEPGSTIQIDDVLMVGEGDEAQIGQPTLPGAKVTVEVVEHGRGDKIKIVKFRRRKNSRRQMGHRQWFTKVKVVGIEGS